MKIKNTIKSKEDQIFEEEFQLTGRYDSITSKRVREFYFSIGNPLPTLRESFIKKGAVMNYKENQRQNHVKKLNSIFRDAGKGIFKGKARDFVLSDPKLNLWGGIREDAIRYFNKNKIQWWESGKTPSGHLLSSQIACINHLYFLRQREELATAILKNIDTRIDKALIIDSGFVEFEKTAKLPLGLEKTTTRGANCTSIDAMMLGLTKNGKRIIYLIEWKYTESYSGEDLSVGRSGKVRLTAYDALIKSTTSPIDANYYNDLFFEPFYQMMRQTLLGKHMVANKEYNADEWFHIDVVPKHNSELRNKITSANLTSLGKTISDVWKSVLIDPSRYLMIDPIAFLNPASMHEDIYTIFHYLQNRYW